ncbi:MAG: RagB/SusD family nutrient uptake outer membrane protein [Carboxylicivirga sp.]|nr:RagB/SusD family nutrient uptake outer membrane protein [Carboxylicivirga sp.]
MIDSKRFFYNEALSDNAYVGRGDQESVNAITQGNHNPSTGRFSAQWSWHYRGIKTCHVFLENIDRVPDANEAVINRFKAECRFMRAFHYFYLTNWFGDVPFFTTDISLEESKVISRTDKATVLKWIHEELKEIQQYLPVNTSLPAEENGRITKGAAVALNARVYLYNNDWTNVVSECEKLMTSTDFGEYQLFGSYPGLFEPENENNGEVIFDSQFVPSKRTYGYLFDLAPLSVGARLNDMAATQELVDEYLMLNGKYINEAGSGYDETKMYEDRDPRMGATLVYHGYEWTKPDGNKQTIYIEPNTAPDENSRRDEYVAGSNSTSTGYYLRKYYDKTSEENFKSGLNLILLRYADVLMMYAEAKNELTQMDETVWNSTLKAIRTRAGFTNDYALNFNSSLDQDDMRKVIQKERRAEFAMEGLRIYDIRRWRSAETVLNGFPHGAKYGDISVDNGYIRLNKRTFNKNRDYLWPVPLSEKDKNPNLGQNPGW